MDTNVKSAINAGRIISALLILAVMALWGFRPHASQRTLDDHRPQGRTLEVYVYTHPNTLALTGSIKLSGSSFVNPRSRRTPYPFTATGEHQQYVVVKNGRLSGTIKVTARYDPNTESQRDLALTCRIELHRSTAGGIVATQVIAADTTFDPTHHRVGPEALRVKCERDLSTIVEAPG